MKEFSFSSYIIVRLFCPTTKAQQPTDEAIFRLVSIYQLTKTRLCRCRKNWVLHPVENMEFIAIPEKYRRKG
jgi:hypothetical protein